MTYKHKKSTLSLKHLVLILVAFLGLWGFSSEGFAQIDHEINKVNNVRFAPHPLYTRVVFELDKNVHYRIIPNFKKGIISILFENSTLSEKIKDKIISDKRIAGINMAETASGEVRFDIKVNFTKNTFFHMPMENPPRVVFDIKNKTQVVFKDRDFKFAKAGKKKGRAELETEKKEPFLKSALSKFNFKKDYNDFIPHLTLARIKFLSSAKDYMGKLKQIKPKEKEFKIESFKLIKSELTRQGPVYTDVETFNS